MDFNLNDTVTMLYIDGKDFTLGTEQTLGDVMRLLTECSASDSPNPIFYLINKSGRLVYFNFNNIHSIEVFTE